MPLQDGRTIPLTVRFPSAPPVADGAGTVANGGTASVVVSTAPWQRVQSSGTLNVAFSGWPGANVGSMVLLEIVNGGLGATNFGTTVNFIKADGKTSPSPTRTLQSAGTDYILVFRRGSTLYGKVA